MSFVGNLKIFIFVLMYIFYDFSNKPHIHDKQTIFLMMKDNLLRNLHRITRVYATPELTIGDLGL